MNVKASTLYKREHKADYGRERLDILYEDDALVVINKPSGMLSVPYPGSRARTAQDVLEKILHRKVFVVHRLDRDTSGVMMFALSEGVQHKVMAHWHTMVTERLYRAVAENPRRKEDALPDSGTIDAPLAQNARHVGYVPHEPDDHAKTVEARTHFAVIARGKTHTLFELSLDTGKKNQIRAHLASRHYPLAGDENYRARTDPFHRLALHARTLAFVHPLTAEHLKFEVPESGEWLSYVERGDSSPAVPVWRDKSSPYNKKPADSSRGTAVPQKPVSRKELRKMDFIAKGHHKQR